MQQNQAGSKAYLISIVMVAVLGGLLFGYDTAVISGAEKGLQAFFMEAKDFSYTDGWHGFTSASALIGCIIGSALSGFLATNLGRKKSLIIAGILFFISALGSMDPEFLFFEHGTPTFSLLIMFNIYRIIGGIGVGLASAICPMYIGEVAPSNIRGMLVSWNQFAIIFGQLVVYFVNFFILGDHIQPLVEEMGKGLAAINPAAQWTVTTGQQGTGHPVEDQRQRKGCSDPAGYQGYHDRKNREAHDLRCHVYLHRYHAQRVPAGCGYQCRALLRSAYLW